jgi:hypothetical protein
MTTIKIDFAADWAATLEEQVASLGYQIATGLSPGEVCHRYATLRRRLISQRPRTVSAAAGFVCPPDLLAGLALLRKKIEAGEELRPHLSRGLADLDSQDMLLNDWGIHHLHLGTKIEADGFVERSGPVLFARFTRDAAYLIAVLKHGSWSCQDFVRVLHRNWPDSISAYRIQGAQGLEQQTSDADIAALRKHAINVPVAVEPGAVYLGMGGGYSTTKMNGEVVRDCARTLETLKKYEDFVRGQVPALMDQARARGLEVGDELSFRLRKLDGVLVALEENTKTVVPLLDGGAQLTP